MRARLLSIYHRSVEINITLFTFFQLIAHSEYSVFPREISFHNQSKLQRSIYFYVMIVINKSRTSEMIKFKDLNYLIHRTCEIPIIF